MQIIIEGPNGSGKTTLARELSAKYGLTILHATKPVGTKLAINKALDQYYMTEPVIFDRSHAISRLVYQQDFIGELETELLTSIARKHSDATGITTIYCTGRGKHDTNKPHYDEQLIEATKDQEKIRALYDKVMGSISHIKYNFEIDEISSLQL